MNNGYDPTDVESYNLTFMTFKNERCEQER